MAVKDMTGLQIGKLTVIERDTTVPYAAAYWKCKCECGNEKTIRGTSLRDGSVVDCGCGKKVRRKESTIDTTSLVGKRFEKIVVLERDMTKPIGHGYDPYWICQCDCGTIKSILGRSLKSGHTKSCGCLSKELKSQRSTANIAGERFGKLTALEKTDEQKHGSYIWKCKCDCGETYYASVENLRAGHATSCGCDNRSKGEKKIAALLTDANIRFAFQHTFTDCRNSKTNYKYFFDFAIFDKDGNVERLIEFDGIQHFVDNKDHAFFDYNDIHFRDTEKNIYAKEKKIPLVRIPYTQLNQLTLEDLLGERFII